MLRPNLYFVGPTGAGKTTVGKMVARKLRMSFMDIDQAIEKQTGADISLIFDVEGEAGFRARETAMLASTEDMQETVVATGAGIVLAEENRALLQRSGVVVYLATTVDVQLRRLERDKQRPLLQAPDRRERLHEMARIRQPLYQSVADVTLQSGMQRVNKTAHLVLEKLRKHLPEMA